MTRGAAVAAVVVVAGLLVPAVPYAQAQPDGCAFQLSAPELVNLPPSGAAQVVATLQASSCNGLVQPTLATVCIAVDGDNGTCALAYGWNKAQVAWAPPRGRATYVATGRGCTRAGLPSVVTCEGYGPTTATVNLPD